MTIWNQASLKWRNYRVPSGKKYDKPGEQPLRIVGTPLGPNSLHLAGPANEYPDVGCRKCGFIHCARIPGKCVPPSDAMGVGIDAISYHEVMARLHHNEAHRASERTFSKGYSLSEDQRTLFEKYADFIPRSE